MCVCRPCLPNPKWFRHFFADFIGAFLWFYLWRCFFFLFSFFSFQLSLFNCPLQKHPGSFWWTWNSIKSIFYTWSQAEVRVYMKHESHKTNMCHPVQRYCFATSVIYHISNSAIVSGTFQHELRLAWSAWRQFYRTYCFRVWALTEFKSCSW